MSRDMIPGNGVPQLQNLHELLAYSNDMGQQVPQMNGGGLPGLGGAMNGNLYTNGSQGRKNDYVDSGVGK